MRKYNGRCPPQQEETNTTSEPTVTRQLYDELNKLVTTPTPLERNNNNKEDLLLRQGVVDAIDDDDNDDNFEYYLDYGDDDFSDEKTNNNNNNSCSTGGDDGSDEETIDIDVSEYSNSDNELFEHSVLEQVIENRIRRQQELDYRLKVKDYVERSDSENDDDHDDDYDDHDENDSNDDNVNVAMMGDDISYQGNRQFGSIRSNTRSSQSTLNNSNHHGSSAVLSVIGGNSLLDRVGVIIPMTNRHQRGSASYTVHSRHNDKHSFRNDGSDDGDGDDDESYDESYYSSSASLSLRKTPPRRSRASSASSTHTASTYSRNHRSPPVQANQPPRSVNSDMMNKRKRRSCSLGAHDISNRKTHNNNITSSTIELAEGVDFMKIIARDERKRRRSSVSATNTSLSHRLPTEDIISGNASIVQAFTDLDMIMMRDVTDDNQVVRRTNPLADQSSLLMTNDDYHTTNPKSHEVIMMDDDLQRTLSEFCESYAISLLPEKCDKPNFFFELPTDVQLYIFEFLSDRDRLGLSLVNRQMHELVSRDFFWHDRYVNFVQSREIQTNKSILTFIPELRFVEPNDFRKHLVATRRKQHIFQDRRNAERYFSKYRLLCLFESVVVGPAIIAGCFIVSTILFGMHYDSIIAPSQGNLTLVFMPMVIAVVVYLIGILTLLLRETLFFQYGFFDLIHFFHFLSCVLVPFPIFFLLLVIALKLLFLSSPRFLWSYASVPCIIVMLAVYLPMIISMMYKAIRKRMTFDEIVYDADMYRNNRSQRAKTQRIHNLDTEYDMNSVVVRLSMDEEDDRARMYDSLYHHDTPRESDSSDALTVYDQAIRNRLLRYKRAEQFSRSKFLLHDFEREYVEKDDLMSDEDSESLDSIHQPTLPYDRVLARKSPNAANLEVRLMRVAQRKDRTALVVLYLAIGVVLFCSVLTMVTIPLKLDGFTHVSWGSVFAPLWVIFVVLLFGIPLYLLFGILTDVPPRRLVNFWRQINKDKENSSSSEGQFPGESGGAFVAFIMIPFFHSLPGLVGLILLGLKLDNFAPNIPLTAGCAVLAIWQFLLISTYVIVALPFSLLAN